MAVGIVAEFNPFHNGHKYLVETAKTLTNDSVVAVMSGAFVQRGGIAITDKLKRAEMALKNGVDLVIELPVTFSHNTAQKFALGAIATLNATGVIDTLAFGSECGDKDNLMNLAKAIANEPTEVSAKIKDLLSQGMSYPTARAMAYEGIYDITPLNTPNDILGIEYIRACFDLGISPEILPISRIGTKHDSNVVTGNIASASEIRRRRLSGDSVASFMPDCDFTLYDPKLLDLVVISKLRLATPDEISNINDMAEGLENKIIAEAKNANSVDELAMAVKSKRYTLSRIRRILYSTLLGLTKDLCALPPSYIRVLGMNDRGRDLLRKMKETATLPVIIKPADYHGDPVFNANSKAEDIFALCSTDPQKRTGAQDLKMTPVIL